MTEEHTPQGTVSRRSFIEGLGFATGGVVVGTVIGAAIPGFGGDDDDGTTTARPDGDGGGAGDGGDGGTTVTPMVATAHPRVKIGSVSALNVGDVIDFKYPTEQSAASLVKLGRPAAGGLGEDGDIVAFGTDCTHMGCPLAGTFKVEHGILGPCGCHFTTFDLGRRGSVVLGQATENLPQILLDIDGDDIYAVGTLGIFYGFRDNLADVTIVEGI
jgi:arsenite oxidase small subunit